MSTQNDTVRYELMVIVSPDIGETAINKRLEAIKKSIKDFGGEFSFEDLWGLRNLAYAIRKHDQGYYAVLDFDMDPEKVKELDRMLRLEVEVLRHLLMKLPAVYQPKTLTDMEAEAAVEQEKEDAIREEKREKKLGRHVRTATPRVETPKAEVKAEKPVEKAAKAPKQEVTEEAPKETAKKAKEAPKKKDAEADKKALEDIDAKLDSILSNPDINF